MSFQYQESFSSTSGGGGGGFSAEFSSGGGAADFSSSSAQFSSGGGGASFSAGGGSGAAGSSGQIARDLLTLGGGSGGSSAGGYSAGGSAGGYSAGGSAGGYSAGGSASFSASASGSAQASGLSEIEAAILRSTVPIDVNETEEITVNGQRGIWANRAEVANWRGVIPITQYQINEDQNPEVVTKRSSQVLEYIQELAIRYLRPPTPPAPGEIVITQESNTITPPAPPLVIRQQPPRPSTPEPLVIREAPPQPPKQVGRKVITISGKRIPPPPRKVVIERLAPLPSKPQSIFIERWLPYAEVKRRVIFQKSQERDAVVVRPRNVVVQWEAPQVRIKKEFKYLGVVRANPVEYVQKYGSTLKVSRDLPQFVHDVKTPDGMVLAADYQAKSFYELEGDVSALRLIDLDREGLSEYRSYLERFGGAGGASFSSSSASYAAGGASSGSAGFGASSGSAGFGSSSFSAGGGSFRGGSSAGGSNSAIIQEIFSQIDGDASGSISVDEAEKILLRLNSRLGRNYGENEVRAFFRQLDTNRDGRLSIEEFRRAFERL